MNKDYVHLENENIVRRSDSWVRKRKTKEKSGTQGCPGENCQPNRWVSLNLGAQMDLWHCFL